MCVCMCVRYGCVCVCTRWVCVCVSVYTVCVCVCVYIHTYIFCLLGHKPVCLQRFFLSYGIPSNFNFSLCLLSFIFFYKLDNTEICFLFFYCLALSLPLYLGSCGGLPSRLPLPGQQGASKEQHQGLTPADLVVADFSRAR